MKDYELNKNKLEDEVDQDNGIDNDNNNIDIDDNGGNSGSIDNNSNDIDDNNSNGGVDDIVNNEPVVNEVDNGNEGEDGVTSAPMMDEGAEGGEKGTESIEDEKGIENIQQPQEKMLTQSQVNELVGKARMEGRDSAVKDLYGRYGVNGDEELNDIFGKGQAYEGLNDEFVSQKELYKQVMAENALLKSHVEPSRWEDIKLILGGKGLDITQENIESMIPSHPEWRSIVEQQQQPSLETGKVLTPEMAKQFAENPSTNSVEQKAAVLRKLGNEPTVTPNNVTEEEQAAKLFGQSLK